MRIKLQIIALFISVLSFAQNKGSVTGTILDKQSNNQPLPSANVVLKGTGVGVNADIDGKYTIAATAGTYTLQFSFVGYQTVEIPVSIVAGETITVNQTLSSGDNNLKEIVVKSSGGNREKETALLLEQKKATEIKQSIGAQEMSRKGISDVEEGLTKVTGITKVDGRGLFVRGLEDRYNNLLINGLAVPSNNPFKKIIPLDIFPTDIVSVIDTYKTFNTNIYGDFAGATFDITTAKGGKSITKVNFGAGFTTNNNLRNFLISKDATGTSDFFGFSDNDRNLPNILTKNPSNQDLTAAQSNSAFNSGFDVEQTQAPLNTNFGILNSDKFNIGKNNINYLFSFNYDNKFQFREGLDRFFDVGGLYENNLTNKQYKFITNNSALLALNFKSNRLSLTSNTFYLKTTENMIQDQLGSTNLTTVNTNSFIRLNQLMETTFFNTQLLANYKLTSDDKHNIKSGISFTRTSFELPDRKSFKGIKIDDNNTALGYTGNSLYRQYFDIKGTYFISGMLDYTFKFGNDDLTKANKFSFGYNGYSTKMKSLLRFLISDGSSTPVNLNTNTPDAFLASQINSGQFFYKEGTNSTYYADKTESTHAAYADLAFKFGEKYELNFGARLEQFNRKIRYREAGLFDSPLLNIITNDVDLYSALNMKYALNEKSNLRFAASRTKTKPVVMEIYPLEFVNLDGTLEIGNPDVVNSGNYNFDLKYEFFPTTKEMFSVAAFSKLLENPIERIFTNSAGSGGQVITYGNSKKGFVYGVEFEFLVQLERLSKSFADFSLGFNTSLMQTEVTIDKVKNSIETVAQNDNSVRQLQGASPWLINADLKYEFDFNKDWKNTITLVYNVYGDRIFAVGTRRLDHYYEKSFHKLDLVWGSKINKNWDFKFTADNILNPYYRIVMGNESKIEIKEKDLTIKDFKRGVGFSFNVSYTF